MSELNHFMAILSVRCYYIHYKYNSDIMIVIECLILNVPISCMLFLRVLITCLYIGTLILV